MLVLCMHEHLITKSVESSAFVTQPADTPAFNLIGANMNFDCHLKLDGIEGESTHASHKNEIYVKNFTIGANNPIDISGGGMAAGKPASHGLTITKSYCKASPTLYKTLTTGKHIDKAVISVSKSGDGQKDFMTITMSEVVVVSYSHSAGEGDNNEVIVLGFASIKYDYKPQDSKGAMGGSVIAEYNFKKYEAKA